jgi:hypothetical protein
MLSMRPKRAQVADGSLPSGLTSRPRDSSRLEAVEPRWQQQRSIRAGIANSNDGTGPPRSRAARQKLAWRGREAVARWPGARIAPFRPSGRTPNPIMAQPGARAARFGRRYSRLGRSRGALALDPLRNKELCQFMGRDGLAQQETLHLRATLRAD